MTLLAAALLAAPLAAPAQQSSLGNWLITRGAGKIREVDVPYQGGTERVAVMIPLRPLPTSAEGAPLVVHFHSALGDYLEFTWNMELLQEIGRRGWYLISPSQTPVGNGAASWDTYGNADAKARTRAALDWALANLPVDRSRVYGLGWSMGGGAALSFAAQNVDPERGAFAAIVQHTGTVSLEHEWRMNFAAQAPMLNAFNVPGPSAPPYLRAQALDYDLSPVTGPTWDPTGFNAVRNVSHLSLQSWFELRQRTVPAYAHHYDELDDLDLIFGNRHDRREGYGRDGSDPHAFGFLDPDEACDFLEGAVLTVPGAGRLAVTRDGRYHDLHLERRAPASSPFAEVAHFDLGSPGGATRTLSFERVRNLRRIEVDAAAGPLPDLTFVDVDRDPRTSPASRVEVVLRDFGSAPNDVTVDLTAATQGVDWWMQGEDLHLHAAATTIGVGLAYDSWTIERP